MQGKIKKVDPTGEKMKIGSYSPLLSDSEREIMDSETLPLYVLPEGHKEIFGSNQPLVRQEIYHKVFGYAGRSFSRHIYPLLSTKEKEVLFKKYIKNVRLDMLNGITPEMELGEYQWLINSVKEDGIKVPLVAVIDSRALCWVLEGHRRAGVASVNKMKYVPTFILLICDGEHNHSRQMEKYNELIEYDIG